MHEQERRRSRSLSRDVDKVEVDVLDPRAILREFVQTPLGFTPIEIGAPVVDQTLEIPDIGAVGPSSTFYRRGKSSVGEPLVEVVKYLVWHGDLERRGTHRGHQ
nr:hypothetical protein [Flaviflexus salsibiostraticola]